MSMFRAKKLDLGCFVNIRTIRDHTKRQVFMEHEPERQALRHIIRNATLPPRVRAEAQLQLSQMHSYTRSTQIRNRCILGGKSRGVFRDFKMTRYNFRMQAYEGNLPDHLAASSSPLAVMFRRRWSALPEDPVFPSDIKKLGYFIDTDDEIHKIGDPSFYFKYFLTKNERVNDRQRFHFNGKYHCSPLPASFTNLVTEAIRDVVHERLENLGMSKTLLPLGTPATSPHVPIFISANLSTASRVVVIFGEPCQDLGNVALRVANRSGGIDKGSMVSIVRELLKQRSSAIDASPPGIILANAGELWWWPEGQKPLSPVSACAVPMASMVHHGRAHNPKVHAIPKNEHPLAHIEYILNEAVPAITAATASLDIIGVGLSADHIMKALDSHVTFDAIGKRINTLSVIGCSTSADELSHEPLKDLLVRRGRAYITDEAAAMTPVAKPGGNPNTASFTQQGCTVFSSGEVYYIELMFITSRVPILAWLEEVAKAGSDYRHPEIVPVNPAMPTDEEWAATTSSFDKMWEQMPEYAKPSIGYAVPKEVAEQAKALEELELHMEAQVQKQLEINNDDDEEEQLLQRAER
ncbi:hypothetical protein K4K49_007699 [Colletotrichum sp. SAR 10_70]|nr:hypothetical protein K4K49_007699 [Colletotrichum sp. SAR 10_70]KAI8197852.1 hypothetical protein KHU50_009271 [Colletotrichum sp. SAR 10_65]